MKPILSYSEIKIWLNKIKFHHGDIFRIVFISQQSPKFYKRLSRVHENRAFKVQFGKKEGCINSLEM